MTLADMASWPRCRAFCTIIGLPHSDARKLLLTARSRKRSQGHVSVGLAMMAFAGVVLPIALVELHKDGMVPNWPILCRLA
jgi:hypothetical protein